MKLDAIEVITLFVPNIAEVLAFYLKVFDAPIVYEDEVSAVFGFAGMMVNVLEQSQAPELVTPRNVGTLAEGSRMLLTIKVDDVDAEYSRLRDNGVAFLNGPINRPWGRRTAAFADPGGILWELAQEIEAP